MKQGRCGPFGTSTTSGAFKFDVLAFDRAVLLAPTQVLNGSERPDGDFEPLSSNRLDFDDDAHVE